VIVERHFEENSLYYMEYPRGSVGQKKYVRAPRFSTLLQNQVEVFDDPPAVAVVRADMNYTHHPKTNLQNALALGRQGSAPWVQPAMRVEYQTLTHLKSWSLPKSHQKGIVNGH